MSISVKCFWMFSKEKPQQLPRGHVLLKPDAHTYTFFVCCTTTKTDISEISIWSRVNRLCAYIFILKYLKHELSYPNILFKLHSTTAVYACTLITPRLAEVNSGSSVRTLPLYVSAVSILDQSAYLQSQMVWELWMLWARLAPSWASELSHRHGVEAPAPAPPVMRPQDVSLYPPRSPLTPILMAFQFSIPLLIPCLILSSPHLSPSNMKTCFIYGSVRLLE